MLSYQHAYHAGNAADVHKHALLAWTLDYLTRKDKPLSYLESHAGRGLYDLSGPEATRTGEAAEGVQRLAARLAADHPYRRSLDILRARHGPAAYPGSPLIAATLLRDIDRIDLAERHPQERAALEHAMAGTGARIHAEDGPAMALRHVPPQPRRGLLLVDPSYEVKADYEAMATLLPQIARRWNVGILMLWYPLLSDARHRPILARLEADFPRALRHEVGFPPARKGHRMVGSGLFVANPPWGLDAAAADLTRRCFDG